jgi:hypothetical protein
VNSLVLKIAIMLLIPVTMAWKLTVATEDVAELQAKLVKFLSDQHLEVQADTQTMGDMPMLHAGAGACHLLVAKVSAVGSNRDVIRGLATKGDEVFTVFRGVTYPEQPTTWTVLTYLWSKVLSELGLMRHIVPVFAVVASPLCNAKQLPWEQLQRIEYS